MNAKIAVIPVFMLIAGMGIANAAPKQDLVDFFVEQGCAIGPLTRAVARSAGFSNADIDALVAEADDTAETIRTGDWIVLPTSLCRISPPDVRSEIRLDDPEVQAVTTSIDAYAEYDEIGCFLSGQEITERVQETRGWGQEKAFREYLRFLAENLRSHDITFYSDDMLKTPPGFQVLTGDCADVPNIEDIRRSQVLRDQEFDTLVRADSREVVCLRDDAPSYRFMELAEKLTGGENSNVFMSFEVKLMALGGGWFVGTSATQKGAPRPPLCRFE
ncbi:hypothetical protein [Afifella marina]|uniref:Uncharacterized protein n=1 Tax=Afifella marina DSM 2698 TaxID=1120955 RepID=A0A1G5MMM2_AFIMA|nr:hypothetical protein [Afifella marina]MBK1623973.1 hypothetical protein [Afifella marina DSM 2698]MBK1627111.1 hypothetical protein [Afifella marina]MBK5918860.1 hypothetical protein [Afifella marina]RAI22536.1 hypothetical protein CH311_02380 [Afifella marina DSM 2698]SCZ26426.1 hypothetical protein SAMN03080610_00945 [Afifella marina DSM 2698]